MRKRLYAGLAAILAVIILAGGCGRRMTESRFRQACLNPRGSKQVESMLRSDPSLARIRDEGGLPLLHGIAMAGDPRSVDVLVRCGADVNATGGPARFAPLHAAALCGRVEAAERLIRAGADVDLGDKYRETPLYLAVITHNLQMVELLVQAGADVNASRTIDGRSTPLAMAQGNKLITNYLRQHGARLCVPRVPGKH